MSIISATKNSKEALRERAIAMLIVDLKRAEERANREGWIEVNDLEEELINRIDDAIYESEQENMDIF